jgi:hypothetical protein
MPMTTSRTASPAVKCFSVCAWDGIEGSRNRTTKQNASYRHRFGLCERGTASLSRQRRTLDRPR